MALPLAGNAISSAPRGAKSATPSGSAPSGAMNARPMPTMPTPSPRAQQAIAAMRARAQQAAAMRAKAQQVQQVQASVAPQPVTLAMGQSHYTPAQQKQQNAYYMYQREQQAKQQQAQQAMLASARSKMYNRQALTPEESKLYWSTMTPRQTAQR